MFEAYKNTDPEYAAILEQFAGHEVPEEAGAQLPAEDRWLAVLATLLGCQGVDAFRAVLPEALDTLTPVMVKEVVYQATDYLGIGRVLPFVKVADEVLTARGVALPLEGQATTTAEDRLEKGCGRPGDHLRRGHEGSLESWHRQPLAGCQLLRRLLHPQGPGPAAAGTHYLLLPVRPGRL